MKKDIIAVKQGHRADIGEYKIHRALPDHEVRAAGSFVFLDYVPPVLHAAGNKNKMGH